MKGYEKSVRTIYEPVKLGSKSKFGRVLIVGLIAYGAYKLYKKYTDEDKYEEFDTDLGEKMGYAEEDDEEEKFAEKILNAAKKAGKDVEGKVDKIKKSLN